jgi:hypothetical protein
MLAVTRIVSVFGLWSCYTSCLHCLNVCLFLHGNRTIPQCHVWYNQLFMCVLPVICILWVYDENYWLINAEQCNFVVQLWTTEWRWQNDDARWMSSSHRRKMGSVVVHNLIMWPIWSVGSLKAPILCRTLVEEADFSEHCIYWALMCSFTYKDMLTNLERVLW